MRHSFRLPFHARPSTSGTMQTPSVCPNRNGKLPPSGVVSRAAIAIKIEKARFGSDTNRFVRDKPSDLPASCSIDMVGVGWASSRVSRAAGMSLVGIEGGWERESLLVAFSSIVISPSISNISGSKRTATPMRSSAISRTGGGVDPRLELCRLTT